MAGNARSGRRTEAQRQRLAEDLVRVVERIGAPGNTPQSNRDFISRAIPEVIRGDLPVAAGKLVLGFLNAGIKTVRSQQAEMELAEMESLAKRAEQDVQLVQVLIDMLVRRGVDVSELMSTLERSRHGGADA